MSGKAHFRLSRHGTDYQLDHNIAHAPEKMPSPPCGIAAQSISPQKEVGRVLVSNIVCLSFPPFLPLSKGEEAVLRTEIRIWNLLTRRIMDLFCSENALIVDLFTSAPSLKERIRILGTKQNREQGEREGEEVCPGVGKQRAPFSKGLRTPL